MDVSLCSLRTRKWLFYCTTHSISNAWRLFRRDSRQRVFLLQNQGASAISKCTIPAWNELLVLFSTSSINLPSSVESELAAWSSLDRIRRIFSWFFLAICSNRCFLHKQSLADQLFKAHQETYVSVAVDIVLRHVCTDNQLQRFSLFPLAVVSCTHSAFVCWRTHTNEKLG